MSLNKQVFAAFDAFVLTMNGATQILRQKLVDLNISVEECSPYVIAWAGERHGVALVEGQRKAKGRMVLDSDAKNYEAAKKAAQRMMDALTGDADKVSSPKSEADAEAAAEEIEIPADILAAAAKLAKLCNEYKGAKKLAAKAVAVAFAK
jgi:hypothetical protein